MRIRPLSIALSIDVFNVANSATVLQRQGRLGDCFGSGCSNIVPGAQGVTGFTANGAYHLITDLQSPRVVRAGARVSF